MSHATDRESGDGDGAEDGGNGTYRADTRTVVGSVFAPLGSLGPRRAVVQTLGQTLGQIPEVPLLSIPALHIVDTHSAFSPLGSQSALNEGGYLSFGQTDLHTSTVGFSTFSMPTGSGAGGSSFSAFANGGHFQRVVRTSPQFSSFPDTQSPSEPTSYASRSSTDDLDMLASSNDPVSIARRTLHEVLRVKAASPYVYAQSFQSLDKPEDVFGSTFGSHNRSPKAHSSLPTQLHSHSLAFHSSHLRSQSRGTDDTHSYARSSNISSIPSETELTERDRKIREKKKIKTNNAKKRRLSLAPSAIKTLNSRGLDELADRFDTSTVLSPAVTAKLSSSSSRRLSQRKSFDSPDCFVKRMVCDTVILLCVCVFSFSLCFV